MKKWTKKFLNKSVPDNDRYNEALKNAKKAKKKLDISEELWLDLSHYHNLLESISKIKINIALQTAFMAGVAVGWAEKYRKIK